MDERDKGDDPQRFRAALTHDPRPPASDDRGSAGPRASGHADPDAGA